MRAVSVLVCLALLVIASPSAGFDEHTVFDRMRALIEQDANCGTAPEAETWSRRTVTNPADGYRLRYSRFGCAPGAEGALVLLPGRGEASFEYWETAIDFIDRGYAPVYVVDHRGQGLSPRLLDDPYKGHVARFEDYVDDAAAFVTAVLADLDALGAGPDPAVYLTTNSMGGAVAIGLFQKLGADNPFRAAALLGAQIQVNYHSFTGTDPSWLNLRIYSETGALLQAKWRCGVATFWNATHCEDYAAGDTFGAYRPGTRHFSPETEALMTHSQARFDLRTYLLDDHDWSAIAASEYAEGENWTGPQLGGATNGWVREAARFNRQMRRTRALRPMVHVPVMLLTGSRDLRAYRPYAAWRDRAPDLSRHIDFCATLNAQSLAASGAYICEFVTINGAYHELYKERDAERKAALDTVDWFFRSARD